MEFGDGLYEDKTVQSGSGDATFDFFHEFSPFFPAELVVQRARILETGDYTRSYTVHPDPFGPANGTADGSSTMSCQT
jgi:hypothetical protein